MFCTKCGANIADGAKFCTSCGQKVATEPVAPVVEEATPVVEEATPVVEEVVRVESTATAYATSEVYEGEKSTGFAMAALVLGIVSVAIMCTFIFSCVAWIPAIPGVVMGILGIIKRQPFGKSLAGLIMSGVAFFVGIIVFFALIGATSYDYYDYYYYY